MNWGQKPKPKGLPPGTVDVPYDQWQAFCDRMNEEGRWIFSWAWKRGGFYRVVVQDKPCGCKDEGGKQAP
jgi:hypothetical protein